MRVLIIDNYDSFTYNLYHMVSALTGVAAEVVQNDAADYAAIARFDADAILLAAGPGTPERPSDLGVSADVILRDARPLLGICLGHQALGRLLGGAIKPAPEPMHGRTTAIFHHGRGLFAGLPSPFRAVRYHSLILRGDLPPGLGRDAWTEDQLVMAISDRGQRRFGVQFHPESIASEGGEQILRNFLRLSGWDGRRAHSSKILQELAPRPDALTLHCRKRTEGADPESAFAAFYGASPNAFWLEGGAGFSYMGDDSGPLAEVVRSDKPGGLFDLVQARLRQGVRPQAPGYSGDFAGGFVGYFGYEMKSARGAGAAGRAQAPDAALLFSDRFLAFDHKRKEVWLCALGGEGEAQAWFDQIEAQLDGPLRSAARTPPAHAAPPIFTPRHDREAYLRRIQEALRLIRQGESYEICLTNQFETAARLDPLALYRILRRRNPAPYAAYLRFGDVAVLSSSPEQFLKVDRDRTVHSRPIKGTVARGANPASDCALMARLGASEKERAENLMIVDLVRHDLGRVCEIGSIEVPSFGAVESYATLHQLVSHIRGRLGAGRDAIDALRAAFPGGSMTGAPKVRTMAILDELEGGPRGIYSGALGYLSLSGAADLGMIIRTLVVEQDRITLGAGGAITALSDPECEWDEMLLKADVLMRSVAECVTGNADAFLIAGDNTPNPPRRAAGFWSGR